MTDQQLYLAIGVPAVIAIVGILVNVGYFVALYARVASLESRLDSRIDKVEQGIHTMEQKFDMKFDLLTGKVIELDNRIIRIEERLKH
jgi:hypothetical protein